ncbi:MAG: phosphatase PAP2 family protein [Bacteroidota bacterium]|nr:phosphatase PAP2 family protein [Bacteroidota bacterium]
MDWLIHIDERWFFHINQSGTFFWDPIMLFVTHKLSWIPLYVIIVYAIIKKHQLHSVWVLLIIGLVITLCDMGSVHLFKNTFERLRPCHALDNVRLVKEGCGGQYGFISSHASNVFGLTVILGQVLKNKWVFIGLFFWASLVSYSRIYVGVHYPFDVLAGMLWGTFVALSCYKVYARLSKK